MSSDNADIHPSSLILPPSCAPPSQWLQPLHLPGGHALPNRIFPGPMEGITAGAFCAAMAQLELVRCWITPFIRVSTGIPRRTRLQKWLNPFLQTGLPVVAQVMGVDIANLAGTAARICELGAVGVDLNCGCPSKQVVSNGAGGGRLRSPQWILEALTALREACPGHGISVKLRTGLDSPEEMPRILEAVRAAEPDMVILHHRTVSENYTEVANGWERLARARELLPDLTLIGSGDLFSHQDAMRMYGLTGVDGVAPARGLLRTPQLLRQIEEACAGERCEPYDGMAALRFLLVMVKKAEQQGDLPPKALMKLAAYSLGAQTPVFRRLARSVDMAELHACVIEELQRPAGSHA